MRLLQQLEELKSERLTKVGILQSTVFLQCNRPDGVEIWSVHTLTPGSHQRVYAVHVNQVYYAFSAFALDSAGDAHIFLFIVGQESEADEMLVLLVELWPMRVNGSCEAREYRLSVDAVQEFFTIPLHNATIGAGYARESDRMLSLFIYDRSIVQGPIPYWHIPRNEQESTFSLRHDNIPGSDPVRHVWEGAEDEPRMASRFPIEIDGAKRKFMRLSEDSRLFIFHGNDWIPFESDTGNLVQLSEISHTRGLRETYSMSGHRMTAIESPYSFIADGSGCCVLRHVRESQHHFWRLILDDSLHTFRFLPSGGANFPPRRLSVGRMSYTLANNSVAVVVGSHEMAVVYLQPPSLREIAFWALQAALSNRDHETGAFSNGWTIEQVATAINYMGSKPLIV